MKEYVKIEGSSSIAGVKYNTDDEMLIVHFVQGSEYIYKDVPQEKFQKLLESESKGKYFAKEIRTEYEFEKVA